MLAPAFAAGSIVDSLGFESPAYINGDLKPQNGWNKATQTLAQTGFGTSTAVVESSVANTGSRALQVTRGTLSNDWWGIVNDGYPTGRFVTIDWDMAVNQTFSTKYGPFFGVNAFDFRQDGAAAAGVGVLGTLGVDATTREVLYQAADTGYLTPAVYGDGTPVIINFGAWNHYRILLDFTSHSYDIFLGGVKLGQGHSVGFVDQNNTAGGLQDFTDADITTQAAADDSTSKALTGIADFDNFLVRDGLLGDYDQNGVVDTADYTVWKQSFGSAPNTAGSGADGNANGKIDAADYTVWRDHLGASIFSGAGSGSISTAVPEPSAMVLTLSGLLMAGIRGRRRSMTGATGKSSDSSTC